MGYSKYPGGIDDESTLPTTVDFETEIKAEVVNRLRDSIIATESTLGTDPADGYATIKDRLYVMQTEIDASSGVAAHASTHENGGSDEVTIQNLGSGGAVANKVMVTDGAGGLTLEDHGGGGSFTAGGDLTGDDTEQTVSYIQGLPSPDPADAEVDKRVMVNEGFPPSISNPRAIATDGTYMWVAHEDAAVIWKYNATTRRYLEAYYHNTEITLNGFRTLSVDDDYIYGATEDFNHVVLMDKTDGSIVGWAYTQAKALQAVPDGLGNFYVVVNDGSDPPVAPGGIQKFVTSGVLGQPKNTKTYDAILDNSTGLDGPPRRLAVGGGFVWACSWWGQSSASENIVFKIDTATTTIVASNDTDGLAPGAGGFDLIYAFGYLWVTTQSGASVLRYDPATLAALNNIAIPTIEDAAGITIGPSTAGVANSRLWVTDLDPGASPLPAIYAIDPTGPAYETLVVVGAAYQIAADTAVSTNTHVWIPANNWGNTRKVLVINTQTGVDDDVLGALSLEYKQPFENLTAGSFIKVGANGEAEEAATPAGINNGASRRAIQPYGFQSAEIGSVMRGWATPNGGLLRGMAFTGDGIWVASNSLNSVAKYDLSNTAWNESFSNSSPIANFWTGSQKDLDLAALSPSCTGPVDLAFDGRHVWCACAGTNNIARIEAWGDPPVFLDSFPVGGLGHTPARMIFDGVNMFICGGTTLSKYNRSGDNLGTLTQMTGFTNLVNMIFDGLYLWAIDDGTDQLKKIDGEALTLVDSVNLSSNSSYPGDNKLAFDGTYIYVTRGTNVLDIIDVSSHSVTSVTLSRAFWNYSGDIVFDGRMIKLIYSHTFPSNPTTWVVCFDPTSRRELGPYGSGLSISEKITIAQSIGPGFIIGYDETDQNPYIVCFLTAEAPTYARTHFFGTNNLIGQTGTFTTGLRMENPSSPTMGIKIVSINGLSGSITLRPQQVNASVIKLTGTPSGNIVLNYYGAGPGPFIIHNEATLGANTLTVNIDSKQLTFSPQPNTGESVMFFMDLPGSASRVVRQMKFV